MYRGQRSRSPVEVPWSGSPSRCHLLGWLIADCLDGGQDTPSSSKADLNTQIYIPRHAHSQANRTSKIDESVIRQDLWRTKTRYNNLQGEGLSNLQSKRFSTMETRTFNGSPAPSPALFNHDPPPMVGSKKPTFAWG